MMESSTWSCETATAGRHDRYLIFKILLICFAKLQSLDKFARKVRACTTEFEKPLRRAGRRKDFKTHKPILRRNFLLTETLCIVID